MKAFRSPPKLSNSCLMMLAPQPDASAIPPRWRVGASVRKVHTGDFGKPKLSTGGILGFWPEVPVVLGGIFLPKCHHGKHLRMFHNFQNTLKEGQVNDAEFWPDRANVKKSSGLNRTFAPESGNC